MAKGETVIEARQLVKYFYEPEKFQVLNNIDLEIKKGEFVSVTGSSGSGKSTLLYVLSTLDTDYEGSILFDGRRLDKMTKGEISEFRNESIGFVFQFHYLLPEFTVLHNVCLPALKLGKLPNEQIEAEALEHLDHLGLKEQALKRANKLSGGQQQRVAIARALINKPKVVFGDEPTGNLDSINSGLVFDIFKELAEVMGQTVVIVTHDTNISQRTARRIELKDGMIIQDIDQRHI